MPKDLLGREPHGDGDKAGKAGDRRKQTIIALAAVGGLIIAYLTLKSMKSGGGGSGSQPGATPTATGAEGGGTNTDTQSILSQLTNLTSLVTQLGNKTPVAPPPDQGGGGSREGDHGTYTVTAADVAMRDTVNPLGQKAGYTGLWDIAHRFGLGGNDLMNLNPQTRSGSGSELPIYAGEVLNLSPNGGPTTHPYKPGHPAIHGEEFTPPHIRATLPHALGAAGA